MSVDVTADGRWIAVGSTSQNATFYNISVFSYSPIKRSYEELTKIVDKASGEEALAIADDHEWLFSTQGEGEQIDVYRFNGVGFSFHQKILIPGLLVKIHYDT